MQDFGGKIFDKVEVLVKGRELDSYRHEFTSVKATMSETTLIIIEVSDDEETYRVFNYSDIKAFKLKHNKTT